MTCLNDILSSIIIRTHVLPKYGLLLQGTLGAIVGFQITEAF